MKLRCFLLSAALALLLAGCQAEKPVETVSAPPEPSQEQSALPEPSPAASEPVSVPPEELTPEELLAEQPIDETRDAFLVDTGGKLGTLLVTVELGERGPNPNPEWESWEYPVYLSVWKPADMSQPIQKLEGTAWDVDWNAYDRHEELDANFDGYMDFSVLNSMGNGASSWYLWVWDEGAGQFVEVPEYREISLPRCNPETGVIDGWARNSGAGDGVTTFHRWEDGKLVCVRRIETWWEPDEAIRTEEEITVFPMHLKVEDRIDGELTQVHYQYFSPGESFASEQEKWESLDYHGGE